MKPAEIKLWRTTAAMDADPHGNITVQADAFGELLDVLEATQERAAKYHRRAQRAEGEIARVDLLRPPRDYGLLVRHTEALLARKNRLIVEQQRSIEVLRCTAARLEREVRLLTTPPERVFARRDGAPSPSDPSELHEAGEP